MYTLFRNLNGEDFVLVRPHDPSLVLVWMGRTQCDVVKVHWWVLMKNGANMDERHLYEDCWNGKWKCNFVDPKQSLDILSICF